MKGKKTAIIAISVVMAVVIILGVGIPVVSDLRKTKAIEKYTGENLELYSEINIISECAVIDKMEYSIAGIKEAVRLGADTVTLDLCFKADGTPVITDDYANINADSLLAEDVFKLMTTESYKDVRINFRLKQLVTFTVFNELLNKYDVSKRVFITGIDKARYSLIKGTDTVAKVYFDYTPEDENNAKTEKISAMITEYSLGGVVIDSKHITKELVEALSQKGVSYIINGVNDEIDMYRIMSYGAYAIETDSPDTLKDSYESWRSISLQRLDSSILDNLNK